MINVRLLRTFIIFKRANVKPKFLNVFAKLVVRNASVEVLIQPGHQVIDLSLRNCKAHPFKQIMELLNIDVVVLIYVDFFKNVLERETSLFEHLDDMVKNFVLGVFLFTLNFELL
jgi:hypothetical protein